MNRMNDWRRHADWNVEFDASGPGGRSTPPCRAADLLDDGVNPWPAPAVHSIAPIDGAPDSALVGPAADVTGDLGDVFISLPDGEAAFAVPPGDGMEAFGGRATFGGSDDPRWMLTLLPSPDGHTDDAWFGYPGPGFDPWG